MMMMMMVMMGVMMPMTPEICRAEFGKLAGRCWRFHILNKLFCLPQSLCCLPIMMIMMTTMMMMMMTTIMMTTMMLMFIYVLRMFSIESPHCITLQRCEITALLFDSHSCPYISFYVLISIGWKSFDTDQQGRALLFESHLSSFVLTCTHIAFALHEHWTSLIPICKGTLSCLSLTELIALSSQPSFKLFPVLLLFGRELNLWKHQQEHQQDFHLLLFEIFLVLEELLLKVTCGLDVFCLDPLNESEVVAADLVQFLLQCSLPGLAWYWCKLYPTSRKSSCGETEENLSYIGLYNLGRIVCKPAISATEVDSEWFFEKLKACHLSVTNNWLTIKLKLSWDLTVQLLKSLNHSEHLVSFRWGNTRKRLGFSHSSQRYRRNLGEIRPRYVVVSFLDHFLLQWNSWESRLGGLGGGAKAHAQSPARPSPTTLYWSSFLLPSLDYSYFFIQLSRFLDI